MAKPKFYTYANQVPGAGEAAVMDKRTGQVSYRPLGVGFTKGRGYYARPMQPTQEKPAPATGTNVGAPATGVQLDPRVAPYLQPQLDIIDKQDAANQRALTSFTQAVLQQLQGVAPQVASDYDTAINQSRNLAQAGADSLRNANGNQAIQSILQAAGAPEGQQQQVASQLGNVFNGGSAALFGSQGVFPGQQLIRDKASNVAFANQLPGINALAGTAALKNLLFNTGLEREKVLAQAPSILSDIAKNDAAAASAKAEADYKKQYLQYLGDTLGVKKATAKTSAAQGAARIKIAATNAQLRQQQNEINNRLRAAEIFGKDPVTGKPTLQAKKAAAAANANAKKAASLTPSQYTQLTQKAGRIAETLYYGVPPDYITVNGQQVKKKGTGTPGVSYSNAIFVLLHRFKGLKLEDAQNILADFYKPGEDGRPFLDFQTRQTLAAVGVPESVIDLASHNEARATSLMEQLRSGQLKQIYGSKNG